MKLGLITDVHEHVEHLREALDRLGREQVDQIVVIGDLFEMGGGILETCRLLAEAKAVGAAMLNRDGASLAELAKDRPAFFSVADRLVRVPIMPGLGSMLIRRGDQLLGAIGVSGGRPEQDLECAVAGLSEG